MSTHSIDQEDFEGFIPEESAEEAQQKRLQLLHKALSLEGSPVTGEVLNELRSHATSETWRLALDRWRREPDLDLESVDAILDLGRSFRFEGGLTYILEAASDPALKPYQVELISIIWEAGYEVGDKALELCRLADGAADETLVELMAVLDNLSPLPSETVLHQSIQYLNGARQKSAQASTKALLDSLAQILRQY
jgi:hypothetical protein